MFKKHKTKRGESIIEVMVATVIILTALSAIMTLFSSSIHTNTVTKERVIALNLAREGIEAIRYIRDTNWLNYSNTRRLCWNFLPEVGFTCEDSNDDDINEKILNGNYNTNLDTTNFTWSIDPDTDGIDADNILYLQNGFYTTSTGSLTPFFRQIQISYPNATGSGGTPIDSTEDNQMKVVSIVKWGMHEINLETTLTDFFERSEHDS